MQPVSNLKQSRVNRILGRTGVRLWGLFVLGALLSIGIVALMIVFSVNAQYQQTLGQQRQLAERVALQTSDYMAKLRNDLQTLASLVPLSPQSPNGLTRLLYSVQQNNPAFMELAITGPDGTDLARATRADVRNTGLLNRSGSEPFQAALRSESYTSRVTAPEQYPEQTLALPIVGENGLAGAVMARIDLTTMWDIVSDAELGQQGYAYVVDDQGLSIVSRDLSLLSATPLTNPVVQEAISSRTEPADSKLYADGLVTPGEPVVGFYQPFLIGPYTWYSIVEQPSRDALARV